MSKLCDPMDCSPPGSSVHGILQAGTLDWVAISFSRGSFQPGIEVMSLVSLVLAEGFFTTSATYCVYYILINVYINIYMQLDMVAIQNYFMNG